MPNEMKKLNEKKATLQTEMESLLNTVKTEERAFTEEEQSKFDELESQINLINKTFDALKKERELTKEDEPSTDGEGKETAENDEQRALEDIEIFANYIRNAVEERADNNLTMGDNGAIVPKTIADKIITRAYDISPILQKATKYNTKGTLEIPVYGKDSEEINMAYAEEFKDLESKSKKFTSVKLENFLAGALTKLSNSLINNTDIKLVDKVIEIMSEDVSRFLEREAIKGTEGKAEGCSKVTLEVKAKSQNVVTAEELIDLKNKIKQVFRKNSMWIMNNDTKSAIEKITDNNGRFLFNDDLTGEYDGKVLGYPAYVSDNMDGMEAGKVAIMFGDFSGLALKQTKDLEIQILRELYATQHATGIVAWTEFDMKLEHQQKIAKLTMATAE